MDQLNEDKIDLLSKYIENRAEREESLEVLRELSSSPRLREIFRMAVAGYQGWLSAQDNT